MTTTWATAALPVGDRAEALRQTIREQVVPVHLELPRHPEQVFADVTITALGSLQVSSVRANPATVRRTPRLVKEDGEPVLFISLQVSGHSTVVQDDRHAVLRPGDIAFYDTRRPYTLLFEQGVDMHFFRIPVAETALPEESLRAVTARTLGGDGSIAGLAAGYLARLAENPGLHGSPAAQLLASPTLELIRAVVAGESGRGDLAAGALHDSLGLRLVEYLRAHLGDRDLSPASVARAHHISVRHLYAVLARSGIVFGAWVRAQRLDACRRELSRVPPSSDTITTIAHRWGFASTAHFSRAFKSAYGVSPRVWREARRLGSADG
ncbi:helix-turn-helix domain-containing protein [Streptomyces sp. NBC_00234]|uniref:AraC-like ligand-binding domain-containing protein n=1 Tax=Streptomyces sp. NBC_00234 TaxID=2903638 RepID=UPI002E2A60B0|nr:helix-turn-helix domain-containing protein [Streptomyces sp. NBC_00234]